MNLLVTALWMIWKWRNANVFRGEKFAGDRGALIFAQAKEYAAAWKKRFTSGTHRKIEMQIHWEPPTEGWVRLNTDGSVRKGQAAAAGVFRGPDGGWLYGFVHFVGSCLVPLAELWGVVSDLETAWERGFRKV